MPAIAVNQPFPLFSDQNGTLLDNAYLYFGVENLEPVSNPITVYIDENLTVPISQPIRTSGGYPVSGGTPQKLYVGQNYSIKILDKNGAFVFASPSNTVFVQSEDVQFSQSGTGAVTRTSQSKLRDAVNVKDFGAIGDYNGATGTDNTLFFQRAVNAVSSTGGVVYVNGGAQNKYFFATQAGPSNPFITIPSNVHIVMDDDVYLITAGGVASGVNGYNQPLSNQKALFVNSNPSTGNSNISITGGKIKCAASSAIGQTHIAFQNVKNCKVQNVTLLDTWSACRMQFSYCSYVTVDNVNVYFENMHSAPYSYEDGIRVGSGCYKVAISNCNIYSGDDCIAINNETSETQNTLTSTTPFAYSVNGASIQDVSVSNVTLLNEDGNVIRVYQGPSITTGTIQKIGFSNFNGRAKHASTAWGSAVSLFDNSGVTTNAIQNISFTGFYVDCSFLGSSGTGTPSAFDVATTGGGIQISNGILGGVSVNYGVKVNNRTSLNNVEVTGCLNDSFHVAGSQSSINSCRSINAGVYGIHIASTASNTVLAGNRVQNATTAALKEDSGASYTIAVGNDFTFSPAISLPASPNTGSYYCHNSGPLNPACSVYRNGNQTITSATYTKVQLNGKDFDTNSNFDSTTNYRFQPTIPGYYKIEGSISTTGSTSPTACVAALYKNGSVVKYGPYIQTTAPASIVSSLVYLNGSTDYVELFAYIVATTAVVQGGSTNTYLSASMIRG